MHNTNAHNSHVTPFVYPQPMRVSNTRVRDARDMTRMRVTRVTCVVMCDVKRASIMRDVTRVTPMREGEPIPACDVKRALHNVTERINVYA
jgi:hypothetical protein